MKRLWQHRWSLWHLAKHVPQTVKAMRYFNKNKVELERIKREFKRHPRQPMGLMPVLSPEIAADNVAAMQRDGQHLPVSAKPIKMTWALPSRDQRGAQTVGSESAQAQFGAND